MKKTLLIALSALLMAGAALAESVEIKVKGMVCSFCAQGLDKKFKARTEVEKVKVTLEDKTIRLDLKQDAALPDDEIEKIIRDAGYNVDSIRRK